MTQLSDPPRLGILGGFTPAATARFYERVSAEFLARAGDAHPDVILHSVPVPLSLEVALISGSCGLREVVEVRALIRHSCELLARSGASLVAGPCNTIQPYLRSSAEEVGIDHVDVIESTCVELARRGHAEATLLATATTVASGGYTGHAADLGVRLASPSSSDQDVVDATILGLAAGAITERAAAARLAAVLHHGSSPRGAVVLGCTDLSGLTADDLQACVVDSLACLTGATCDRLLCQADRAEETAGRSWA